MLPTVTANFASNPSRCEINTSCAALAVYLWKYEMWNTAAELPTLNRINGFSSVWLRIRDRQKKTGHFGLLNQSYVTATWCHVTQADTQRTPRRGWVAWAGRRRYELGGGGIKKADMTGASPRPLNVKKIRTNKNSSPPSVLTRRRQTSLSRTVCLRSRCRGMITPPTTHAHPTPTPPSWHHQAH